MRPTRPRFPEVVAVLHGWRFFADQLVGVADHAPLEEFVRLTRDLYVPAGDIGFWQGTFRDRSAPEFTEARRAAEARTPVAVEILYGDYAGGQRAVSRFGISPRDDGGWLAAAARHWNIDRAAPR